MPLDRNRANVVLPGAANAPSLSWSSPNPALTLDFLAWLAAGPRPYAEVMEAWRTSCPRLSIWEDALADGLVLVQSGAGASFSNAPVLLTDRGRMVLESTASD